MEQRPISRILWIQIICFRELFHFLRANALPVRTPSKKRYGVESSVCAGRASGGILGGAGAWRPGRGEAGVPELVEGSAPLPGGVGRKRGRVAALQPRPGAAGAEAPPRARQAPRAALLIRWPLCGRPLCPAERPKIPWGRSEPIITVSAPEGTECPPVGGRCLP